MTEGNDHEDGLEGKPAAAPQFPPHEHDLREQAQPLHDRLELGEDDRLPWLDSADDLDDEPEASGRMAGFVALGVLLLAALIGGLWFATHKAAPSAQADGSLIEASREPYKVAPTDPGGKTFEGTGDSSFKVSQGKTPDGTAADHGVKPTASASPSATPTAKPVEAPKPAEPAKPAAAPAGGGVGVQVGAFSSQASAEAAWAKLSAQYAPLKGHGHRAIEGKADMGTVWRLQALAADAGSANALCASLKSAGLACQVKP